MKFCVIERCIMLIKNYISKIIKSKIKILLGFSTAESDKIINENSDFFDLRNLPLYINYENTSLLLQLYKFGYIF